GDRGASPRSTGRGGRGPGASLGGSWRSAGGGALAPSCGAPDGGDRPLGVATALAQGARGAPRSRRVAGDDVAAHPSVPRDPQRVLAGGGCGGRLRLRRRQGTR